MGKAKLLKSQLAALTVATASPAHPAAPAKRRRRSKAAAAKDRRRAAAALASAAAARDASAARAPAVVADGNLGYYTASITGKAAAAATAAAAKVRERGEGTGACVVSSLDTTTLASHSIHAHARSLLPSAHRPSASTCER